MTDETSPLLDSSTVSAPKVYSKAFQNPITGSTEHLNQITNYAPIEYSEDIESLVEHQHDESCNIEYLNRIRKNRIRKTLILSGITVYLVVFILELLGILEVPFGFIMGFLLAVGGVMGYRKKGSVPSLIMGLLFSIIFLISGSFTYAKNPVGYKIAFAVSITLTIVGIHRSLITRFQSYVPLMLFTLGALSTGYYTFKFVI